MHTPREKRNLHRAAQLIESMPAWDLLHTMRCAKRNGDDTLIPVQFHSSDNCGDKQNWICYLAKFDRAEFALQDSDFRIDYRDGKVLDCFKYAHRIFGFLHNSFTLVDALQWSKISAYPSLIANLLRWIADQPDDHEDLDWWCTELINSTCGDAGDREKTERKHFALMRKFCKKYDLN